MRRTTRIVAMSMLGSALMLSAAAIAPRSASSDEVRAITLYTDPASGQVFTRRCKHCVRLGEYIPTGSTEEIEQKVERRVKRQTQQQLDEERAAMRADMARLQAQQQEWNAEMSRQVSTIQPFAQEFGDRWYKKISVGTLIYGNYGYWTHTGFGPQFTDGNQMWPGPGNNSFNEFAITRAYLDTKFTPTDDISFRLTPDIYAMVNTGTTCTTKSSGGITTTCVASTGDKVGKNSGIAQSDDGNMGLRLKFAYLDYNTFFKKVLQFKPMRDDIFTFGMEQSPLIDWEENLWGFRYTSEVPWSYLGLSSPDVGLSMKGPIKVNETQYADYDFGAFNDGNYQHIDTSAYKQFMGRLTVNPLGAQSRYDSLGLTAFYDYAYSHKCTPDENSSNATCGHITRVAMLGSYTAEHWGLIGEWDYGHNAFSSSNLFTGSGPADAVGIPTTGPSSFAPWNKMVGGILNQQAIQEGWDFLGHVDIPHTPFAAFGLFQQFLPNTRMEKNPLDFQRYDLGVQWLVDKYLRVALDSQAIQYYHDQFTLPAGEIAKKSLAVPFAVPRDTHAFFLNLEFRY
jgi:hypothetical protein